MYRNLNDAIEALQASRGTGLSYPEVQKTIQQMEQAKLDAARDDMEERRGIRRVFALVLANLELEGDAMQLSMDDRIHFVINVLLESRQRVLAAKPTVVEDVAR